MPEHKHAINMYALCSCSECKTCCYFDSETGICHIGEETKKITSKYDVEEAKNNE